MIGLVPLDCVVFNRSPSRILQGPAANTTAFFSAAVPNGEARERTGVIFRAVKRDYGARLVTINDRVRHDSRIERISAGDSNVLAIQVDVLNVGSFRDYNGLAVQRSVYAFLDALEGGFPRGSVTGRCDRGVHILRCGKSRRRDTDHQ